MLAGVDGVLVPGGFGERGIEGKIAAARYARENGIPYLGHLPRHAGGRRSSTPATCCTPRRHSTEFAPEADEPVICLMEEQKSVKDFGGTMRLGEYHCVLQEGSRAAEAYGTLEIGERHRHRFEYNNAYRERLEGAGLRSAGVHPELDLVEVVEIPDHPFYVAVQYHPEFKSRPLEPHPLFRAFAGAAIEHLLQRGDKACVPAPEATRELEQ
jgi:CTP synthase